MLTYFYQGLGLAAAMVVLLLILSWMRKPTLRSEPSRLSEASRQNVVRIDALKGDR